MARKLRVEYAGAIYHVMNRGDRREPIFKDDRDRELFLETLGEASLKADWQVHAWCLMANHFHLVVETPKGNLVSGMKWFLGTYTGRFNRRHKLFGHLFSGRYKALVVGYAMQTDQYPGWPLKAPQTVVNDIFKTYFQFKPSGDGIWVTMGRVNWSWAATSTYTNGQWNVPSETVSNPQYHDDDSFPLWDGNHP